MKNPKSHYTIRTCAVETEGRRVLEADSDSEVPGVVCTWRSKAEQRKNYRGQRRGQGSVREGHHNLWKTYTKNTPQFYEDLCNNYVFP